MQHNSYQRNKHLVSPPCEIHRTILEMNEEKTQINRPKDKKIDDNSQSFTSIDVTDDMYQKREKKDSTKLRMV